MGCWGRLWGGMRGGRWGGEGRGLFGGWWGWLLLGCSRLLPVAGLFGGGEEKVLGVMIERVALLTLQYSAFHPVLDNKISNCDLEDKSAVKTPTPTPAAFSQPPNSNALDAPPPPLPREDSQPHPTPKAPALLSSLCPSAPSPPTVYLPLLPMTPVSSPRNATPQSPWTASSVVTPRHPSAPPNPHLIAIAHAPFR